MMTPFSNSGRRSSSVLALVLKVLSSHCTVLYPIFITKYDKQDALSSLMVYFVEV